jgi:hypothetical protein
MNTAYYRAGICVYIFITGVTVKEESAKMTSPSPNEMKKTTLQSDYLKNGFVVIPKFFSKDECRAMKTCADGMLDDARLEFKTVSTIKAADNKNIVPQLYQVNGVKNLIIAPEELDTPEGKEEFRNRAVRLWQPHALSSFMFDMAKNERILNVLNSCSSFSMAAT